MGKAATSSANILCLILTFSSFCFAEYNLLRTFCGTSKFNESISNTTFEKNLQNLLVSLTSDTPQKGFYNTSVSEGSDQVNGQALCRGDVNDTTCRKCLKKASQKISKQCSSKEAIIWFDVCQIQYSYQEFSSVMTYSGKVPEDRYYHRRNVSWEIRFVKKLSRFIEKLIKEGAVSDPEVMYAAGSVGYSGKEKVYGLVQCTRDIDSGACKSCLESAWGDLKERCSYKEGGIMLSANCLIRFEIYPFYEISSSNNGHKWKKWKTVAGASCATSALAILLCCFVVIHNSTKGSQQDHDRENCESSFLESLPSPRAIAMVSEDNGLTNTEELPLVDLATVRAATDDFSNLNKLGQGGFGIVYKGVLPGGKEVAVKRLSRKSWQGLEEFKNELLLIAKLQHRNLVRLLGCSMEGEEKLLLYEFMPNKSLDSFIFDPEKRSLLDWNGRSNIICGIARGLLYLHEDSRLKIIHRDLKPSNVLLDNEMVAKISDFGLARIFCEDQNSAKTRKVVGTYGYMAPEYAMEGEFSAKSDVFSFGVIMLEIISGKKNNTLVNSQTLIRYAWHLWREGKVFEFVDPILDSSLAEEVIRYLNIGLLCVQDDAADRPTMSSVVALLESGLLSPPKPTQRAFCVSRVLSIARSNITTSDYGIAYNISTCSSP